MPALSTYQTLTRPKKVQEPELQARSECQKCGLYKTACHGGGYRRFTDSDEGHSLAKKRDYAFLSTIFTNLRDNRSGLVSLGGRCSPAAFVGNADLLSPFKGGTGRQRR